MPGHVDKWLSPRLRTYKFTYIPRGAEVISIDAFNRSKVGDDFVIGVTIIKSAESGSPEQYLNIYSDWDNIMDCKQFPGELGPELLLPPLEVHPLPIDTL